MSTRHRIDHNMCQQRVAYYTLLSCLTALVLFGCSRRSSPESALSQPAAAPSGSVADSATQAIRSETIEAKQSSGAQPLTVAKAQSGAQLYARHCAACHGEKGDGKGIAAAFLFPKPRDFRAGRFRLVSTSNNVPTRDDLLAVLVRGMPGSAMPSWTHLSPQERDELVDEIMRLRVEGARETAVNRLKEDEGMSDADIAASAEAQKIIQDEIKNATTPGEGRAVPNIAAPTEQAIARGKDNYAKFVCISCHGATGRGDGVQEMVDDEKLPTRPRDFTLGIFKGSPDPASLYRRIAFGMPGTPMPSSSTMTPEQMVDLVHFIRSLSSEQQRQAAVTKREKIIAKHASAIPSSAAASDWIQIPPAHLLVSPLWWRMDVIPDLQVQAVHDGKTLAIRMMWIDKTPNLESLHSESFKDAIALEIYRGPTEPFLGMGSSESPVDVWFWDADRQNELAAVEQSHPNAVADVYPFSETAVASPELSRPGGRMASQPAIAVPARSAGNQIVPPSNGSGGSALHASGPRTLTFRMPNSQIVEAHGDWANGQWTVVMKRPIVVSAEDGISLEPGTLASIAFAIWDGSHQDRNGQKSITIWQDLEIEK